MKGALAGESFTVSRNWLAGETVSQGVVRPEHQKIQNINRHD